MAKKSVTIKAAWIGVLGILLATALNGVIQFCNKGNAAADKQIKGDFKNNTLSTTGAHSPIIIYQNIQNVHPSAAFTHQMQPPAVVTNVIVKEIGQSDFSECQLAQIRAIEKSEGVTIPIPTNGATRIKPPQLAHELLSRLTAAYNAGDISNAVAISCEGTNLYSSLMAPYKKDLIMVEGSFFEITSRFYAVLAEFSMYKKDYTNALHLIEQSQRLSRGTNTLSIAIQIALYQLTGDDRKMGAQLAFISDHFSHDVRYEIINSLTGMGYLLPYKLKEIAKGKWELQPNNVLEETFKLSKKLNYAPIVRINAGNQASALTLRRWVGLNRYEPFDLDAHFQNLLKNPDH